VDAKQKAEVGLDILDGIADKWAADIDLTSMIKNATSPMNLNRSAPDDVRRKFKDRMEAQISAIVLQAFVEGALRGVDLVNDEIAQMRAAGADLNRPQTS
jgi:hypothetical protein